MLIPDGAERKTWGWRLPLWSQPYEHGCVVRVERIGVVAGGYSSIHRHNQQANVFSVLKGTLCLRLCHPRSPRETVLLEWSVNPGDRPFTFSAGSFHQFEALTEVEALEIYLATEGGDASPQDIERVTQNGIKSCVEA